MRDSDARRQSSKATDASSPNLTVMVHYYCRAAYLFRTVTMYPDVERERVLDDIVTAKSWYCGRYATGHRQSYLKTRVFVEGCMREAFTRKYRPPERPYPVFFYLFPKLSLPEIQERLRRREQLGEPHTKYQRHKGEDDLYFEVQVWDPEILDTWRRSHDIA